MMPVATEMAPELQPIAEPTPGEVVFSPCKKNTNYMAPKSTAAEDKQFVANLEKIIDVLRRDPMMPPPGIEISMSCGYERRTDDSGIYQGKITLLFYPFSDKNHYWHGGLEILVNDIGVMGPRNNAEDRASDPTEVFDLPSPAKYLDYPYLKPENRVWGGLYLSKRPQDIYSFVTYREWLAHNLPRLEAEYNMHKANAEAHPSVHYQVVRRNFQSMYERSLFTSRRTPPSELDTPVWIAELAPADAMNVEATRQVRLNVPGYFNRKLPPQTIQLINILPMHSEYNPLHAVMQKMDYQGLMNLIQ